MYSNTEPLDEMIFFLLVIFSTKYNENKIMFYNYIYMYSEMGQLFHKILNRKARALNNFSIKCPVVPFKIQNLHDFSNCTFKRAV